MQNSQNLLSKTEHRKGAGGYRPGAERCTSSSNGARMHVGCTRSGPVWLVEGHLATQISKIFRESSGLRWICDHGRTVTHGLEISWQAAGFEDRTGLSGFVETPYGNVTTCHLL